MCEFASVYDTGKVKTESAATFFLLSILFLLLLHAHKKFSFLFFLAYFFRLLLCAKWSFSKKSFCFFICCCCFCFVFFDMQFFFLWAWCFVCVLIWWIGVQLINIKWLNFKLIFGSFFILENFLSFGKFLILKFSNLCQIINNLNK